MTLTKEIQLRAARGGARELTDLAVSRLWGSSPKGSLATVGDVLRAAAALADEAADAEQEIAQEIAQEIGGSK